MTTEGVAMMFERFSKQRGWIEKMGLKVSEPAEFDAVTKAVATHALAELVA